MTTNTRAHILLVQHASGDVVGVQFPSVDEARAWEDANGVDAVGCIPVFTRAEVQPAHPCGCPADTVTTPLPGFRDQCGSCAAVFRAPAVLCSDLRPYVRPMSGSRAEMNAELYDQH